MCVCVGRGCSCVCLCGWVGGVHVCVHEWRGMPVGG